MEPGRIMENHENRRNNEINSKKKSILPILPRFWPDFPKILTIFQNSRTYEPLIVEISMTAQITSIRFPTAKAIFLQQIYMNMQQFAEICSKQKAKIDKI